MGSCTSCGSSIPDDQGGSCSMCYGDIAHGSDGYYEQWAMQEDQKAEDQRNAENQMEQDEKFVQPKNNTKELNDDLPF